MYVKVTDVLGPWGGYVLNIPVLLIGDFTANLNFLVDNGKKQRQWSRSPPL